jgi:hypothetical protein
VFSKHKHESNGRIVLVTVAHTHQELDPLKMSDWSNEANDSRDLCNGDLHSVSAPSEPVDSDGQELEEDFLDTSQLGPYDVICGRHKAAFNNIGNRRFRFTVSLALELYLRAPTRKAKSLVIARLADLVHANGGHFFELQKQGNNSSKRASDNDNGTILQWVELSRKKSHQKVGHALRDMALVGTERHRAATQRQRRRRKYMTNAAATSAVAATYNREAEVASSVSTRDGADSTALKDAAIDSYPSVVSVADLPTLQSPTSSNDLAPMIVEPILHPCLFTENDLFMLDDDSLCSMLFHSEFIS